MRVIKKLAVVLLLATLAGTAAFGKKRENVTFNSAVKINGTLVKAGSYVLEFDETANELSVVKGSKVVAKSSVRLEQRDRKVRATQVLRRMEGMDSELVSITFGGSDQDVVLSPMGMQAGGNN